MPLTDAETRAEAHKIAMKKYQQKNKEKYVESSRQYREQNPNHNQEYYLLNAERIREHSRKYQDRRYKFIQEANRLSKILLA